MRRSPRPLGQSRCLHKADEIVLQLRILRLDRPDILIEAALKAAIDILPRMMPVAQDLILNSAAVGSEFMIRCSDGEHNFIDLRSAAQPEHRRSRDQGDEKEIENDSPCHAQAK